ncbi:MAG: hypothetical protein L0241_22130 [Planctomycetia bacterium]|nr:hypothetical protein [Planctomycetia bacterium]
MRWKVAVLGLLAMGVMVGCKDTEQKRNRVSGKVTFNGQPIPYGEVLFTPDDSKKNSGAQGIAPIRDGQYDTSAAGGKGYGGGPAVIRVTGLTGEDGKLLCEYEFQVDLPQGDATHDIDVPAKAAADQKKQPDI